MSASNEEKNGASLGDGNKRSVSNTKQSNLVRLMPPHKDVT